MKINDFVRLGYSDRLEFVKRSSSDELDDLCLQCETMGQLGAVEDTIREYSEIRRIEAYADKMSEMSERCEF